MTSSASKSDFDPADTGADDAAAREGEGGPTLRRGDLLDLVVASCGVSKSDAKPIVEAVLSELGKALGAGRDMNLLPFGKVKIVRENPIEGGRMYVLRVRQPGAAPAPSAEEDDDA